MCAFEQKNVSACNQIQGWARHTVQEKASSFIVARDTLQ